MTNERINQLFETGLITLDEYSDLTKIIEVTDKKSNSLYSYFTLIFAAIGWLLMLTITRNTTQLAILSDATERAWAGFICALLSITAFIMEKIETGAIYSKNNFAYVGIGIDITLFIISIPGIIISFMFI